MICTMCDAKVSEETGACPKCGMTFITDRIVSQPCETCGNTVRVRIPRTFTVRS